MISDKAPDINEFFSFLFRPHGDAEAISAQDFFDEDDDLELPVNEGTFRDEIPMNTQKPFTSFEDQHRESYFEFMLRNVKAFSNIGSESANEVLSTELRTVALMYHFAMQYLHEGRKASDIIRFRSEKMIIDKLTNQKSILESSIKFLAKLLREEQKYYGAHLDRINKLFDDLDIYIFEFDKAVNDPANEIFVEFLQFRECFPFDCPGFENARAQFVVNAENAAAGMSDFEVSGSYEVRKPSISRFQAYLLDFTSQSLREFGRTHAYSDSLQVESAICAFERCLNNTSMAIHFSSGHYLKVLEKWLAAEVERCRDYLKEHPANTQQTQIRKIIEAEIAANDPDLKWQYFFYEESDFQYFLDTMTSFFSASNFRIDDIKRIRLKTRTKAKFGAVIHQIYNSPKVDRGILSRDQPLLQLLKKFSEFEKNNDREIYKTLTRDTKIKEKK